MGYLKLENIDNHDYFVKVVKDINDFVGLGYTSEEIEKKVIENGYSLHIKNKKTKGWHLGIWAVGDWGLKYKSDDEVYPSGYGLEVYKPLTISIFLVHDWRFDKFRPTYSDAEWKVEKGSNELSRVAAGLRWAFSNPIDSYYRYVLEECGYRKEDRFVSYYKEYYYNNVLTKCEKISKRVSGLFCTNFIKLVAKIDKRVAHVESVFRSSEWNNEYEVALVFKYGLTDHDDWRVWNFYQKFPKKNMNLDCTYLEADGSMPKNIWRGVYWEREPDIETTAG